MLLVCSAVVLAHASVTIAAHDLRAKLPDGEEIRLKSITAESLDRMVDSWSPVTRKPVSGNEFEFQGSSDTYDASLRCFELEEIGTFDGDHHQVRAQGDFEERGSGYSGAGKVGRAQNSCCVQLRSGAKKVHFTVLIDYGTAKRSYKKCVLSAGEVKTPWAAYNFRGYGSTPVCHVRIPQSIINDPGKRVCAYDKRGRPHYGEWDGIPEDVYIFVGLPAEDLSGIEIQSRKVARVDFGAIDVTDPFVKHNPHT